MSEADRATRSGGSGFLSLPTSSVGRWSAGLLLLWFGLVMLNALVVLPVTERRAAFELPQRVFVWVTLLCLLSAGMSGLVALVARRERSWAVMLPIALTVLVIGFELVELVFPG